MITRGLQQTQTAGDIVAVVLAWIVDRLPDISERREMKNRDRLVSFQNAADAAAVEDVAALQRSPLDRPIVAIAEIVVSYRKISCAR
jgi:hypothetical protein